MEAILPEQPRESIGEILTRWGRAHVARLRRMSKPKFIAWVTVEVYVVSIPLALIVGLAGEDASPDYLEGGLTLGKIGLALILAPVLETLLQQALPMRIARWLGGGRWVQWLAGAVPFGALHFPNNWSSGWMAIVGGCYLAFTYLRWREESFRAALWMTTGLHAVHNAIALVAVLASGDASFVPPN